MRGKEEVSRDFGNENFMMHVGDYKEGQGEEQKNKRDRTFQESRLWWFGLVERKDVTKRIYSSKPEVEG